MISITSQLCKCYPISRKKETEGFRLIRESGDSSFLSFVFHQTWKLGMHGGDYAWILPSDTIEQVAKTPDNSSYSEECTSSQLDQTLNGLIIVNSHDSALENEITSSGLVSTFPVSALFPIGFFIFPWHCYPQFEPKYNFSLIIRLINQVSDR